MPAQRKLETHDAIHNLVYAYMRDFDKVRQNLELQVDVYGGKMGGKVIGREG